MVMADAYVTKAKAQAAEEKERNLALRGEFLDKASAELERVRRKDYAEQDRWCG
jgi:hypothetical protein